MRRGQPGSKTRKQWDPEEATRVIKVRWEKKMGSRKADKNSTLLQAALCRLALEKGKPCRMYRKTKIREKDKN
jgi:hypothetical protein